MNDNVTPEERQALLTEYQVCEQDNVANSQTYWALSAIFIGISSALLAGLIYGVISNNKLFNALIFQNEPRKILTVGIIGLVLGIAMLIILKKLEEWVRRIQFNQRTNIERMMEIELQIGTMRREWRTRAIDKWHEKFGNKEPSECNAQIWQMIEKDLIEVIDDSLKSKIDIIFQKKIVTAIKNSFRKDQEGKPYYESRSSKKHYPWILDTLMCLWVLVIASTACLMLVAKNHFNWGWSLFAIIIVTWLFTVLFWNKLRRYIKQIYKKLCKERSS